MASALLANRLAPVRHWLGVPGVYGRRPSSDAELPSTGDVTCKQLVNEARHAINCRDFAVARMHLARAFKLDSQSADAHYLFGSMLELTGHPDEAKRYHDRALRLYAEHSLAQD